MHPPQFDIKLFSLSFDQYQASTHHDLPIPVKAANFGAYVVAAAAAAAADAATLISQNEIRTKVNLSS